MTQADFWVSICRAEDRHAKKVTRREFVQTSTAAGVAVGASRTVFGQAPAVQTAASSRWSWPRPTATATRTAAPKSACRRPSR